MLKRAFWYIFVSSMAGTGITSYLAPKLIAWYFDPPVNIGVNCKAATEWAMQRLQLAQMIGLCFGAMVGLFLSFYLKKTPETQATLPQPPEKSN